jgi:disulfide bond formation protein DsbB
MIDRPFTTPLGLLLMSAAILGSVYSFQYIGGLQPCTLCLYQRWPWWIASALAILALLLIRERNVTQFLSGLGALVILAGTGIALYHVGVEQHWWAGPTACSGTAGSAQTLEALRAQIFAAPVVRCDEIPWSLFGISMAGYNVLVSLATGIGILCLLRRNRRMT